MISGVAGALYVPQVGIINPSEMSPANSIEVAIWTAVGICVIQLVLGLVQWAKPNVVIPIIFAILVAFGLASGAFGLVMAGPAGMPETAAAPSWQLYVGLVILVIQLVLHIAGIRGAGALDRIRMAAAQ